VVNYEENLIKAIARKIIGKETEGIKELYGLKETYWRKNQCHIVFYKKIEEKNLPFVETHWGIDFKRKNRSILPELWGRIEAIGALI